MRSLLRNGSHGGDRTPKRFTVLLQIASGRGPMSESGAGTFDSSIRIRDPTARHAKRICCEKTQRNMHCRLAATNYFTLN